ncbi:MSCRAMM family protein [Blautia massiliensis (ex Durand et al. 2017)]|uniref:MSCRAMM family protein n=1 Tax=Blautia massiliensis (ex Durand et al. 2017) TaxID=1737424 RepID=UPI003568DB22
MKKTWKRLCTGFLALATVVTALPTTPVHAESKQYWTESAERVGIIEKVMNDGSIGSTFNEGYMKVEGETAYCIDINTDFKNGYKTRADASSRMSADQISDVALSLEYVKQYGEAHKELNYKQVYLLEQCVVWQRLSVHLGWQCDNVRASYDEIPKATQDEVFSGAKAFVKENKGRYECGGYIYSGEGQELGQFWAKLNVGNAKLQKTSSNTSITDSNGNYSVAGATYGVFSDKDCTKQLATLTTDENGNTDVVEVKAGTVYIKELSAPAGYKVDKTVYSLKVEAGKTATLKVSDTPKITDTLIELFKIDMETQKDNPQGNASLAGAEFTWKYYAGFYNKDNLPAEATRTWITKTIAETDSDGTTHYITKLGDAYKVSGDNFYMQNGKAVLPLGTLTVEETKAPSGYLLDGAYMQAGDKSEQIKGLYLTQITEDGDLAVLSGSNQFSVSDKVIRGGVKIQKRDLETGDTKPQGSATLKDTAFDVISLNDNSVLVEGKLYKKNEVVKTIRTDIEGVASTSADLLPYGKFRIVESEAPDGYLTDGAKPIDFAITENGKIVDLTDEAHSIYNQIKRGDIEGVKIGAGTHKRLADVPFRITSKTTGENHVVVTDDNGQFSTSADWASHKHNTNAGKTSEDGVWFSLLGTVAHATGLVDDTINAENLYSKYPLSNYQLDFYVDNSWSWLPWNWLDGIGKSVQYGLYCITNFVWTISLYLSNATGYVVQEAYKLDFINDMADSIGKSIQTLAGVTSNGFSSSGFYVGFLLLIILVVGLYVAYTGLIKRETSKALHAVINFVVVFVLSASFIAYAPDYIKKINEFSSDISTASLDLGTKIMLPNSDSEGKDSVDLIRDSLFSIQVEQPWLLLQFGNSNAEEIGADRVEALVSASPEDEDGKTREEVVKTEIEDNDNNNLTIPQVVNRLGMVFFFWHYGYEPIRRSFETSAYGGKIRQRKRYLRVCQCTACYHSSRKWRYGRRCYAEFGKSWFTT